MLPGVGVSQHEPTPTDAAFVHPPSIEISRSSILIQPQRVAPIGSFSTLHGADRFPSRGRTRSFSQK